MLEALEIQKKARGSVEARAPDDRSDAPRLPRSRALPRRSGLQRQCRSRSSSRRRTRATLVEDDRPEAGVEQRRARQGHRHRRRSRASPTRRRTSRSSTRTAWPCRTPTRSKAATARTSSSTARASCSTTRWATSTRSPARRTSRATSARRRISSRPGKRMLSSMTPAIVARDGKVVLITGSPGGRTIINTVLNVVLNVTAWEHDRPRRRRRAAHAPSVAARPADDRGERRLDGDARPAQGDGPRRAMRGRQGSAQTIWIDPETGTAYGVADMRDSTAKASKAGS